MENVTEKILSLLNQAQELIQQAKEVYVSVISENAPVSEEELPTTNNCDAVSPVGGISSMPMSSEPEQPVGGTCQGEGSQE